MGIDCYLEFKGMTKAEKEAQITGYDITKGNVGYLRASYGMTEECGLLRGLFSEKFWKGKAVKCDFEKLKDTSLIIEYLNGNGDEYENQDLECLKEILNTINVKFEVGENNDRPIFAKSVIEFIKLGLEKQKAGLKPKVYISY